MPQQTPSFVDDWNHDDENNKKIRINDAVLGLIYLAELYDTCVLWRKREAVINTNYFHKKETPPRQNAHTVILQPMKFDPNKRRNTMNNEQFTTVNWFGLVVKLILLSGRYNLIQYSIIHLSVRLKMSSL